MLPFNPMMAQSLMLHSRMQGPTVPRIRLTETQTKLEIEEAKTQQLQRKLKNQEDEALKAQSANKKRHRHQMSDLRHQVKDEKDRVQRRDKSLAHRNETISQQNKSIAQQEKRIAELEAENATYKTTCKRRKNELEVKMRVIRALMNEKSALKAQVSSPESSSSSSSSSSCDSAATPETSPTSPTIPNPNTSLTITVTEPDKTGLSIEVDAGDPARPPKEETPSGPDARRSDPRPTTFHVLV